MTNEETEKSFMWEAIHRTDYYEGFENDLWVKAKHYGVCEPVLEHMVEHPEDTTVELLGYIDVVCAKYSRKQRVARLL